MRVKQTCFVSLVLKVCGIWRIKRELHACETNLLRKHSLKVCGTDILKASLKVVEQTCFVSIDLCFVNVEAKRADRSGETKCSPLQSDSYLYMFNAIKESGCNRDRKNDLLAQLLL